MSWYRRSRRGRRKTNVISVPRTAARIEDEIDSLEKQSLQYKQTLGSLHELNNQLTSLSESKKSIEEQIRLISAENLSLLGWARTLLNRERAHSLTADLESKRAKLEEVCQKLMIVQDRIAKERGGNNVASLIDTLGAISRRIELLRKELPNVVAREAQLSAKRERDTERLRRAEELARAKREQAERDKRNQATQRSELKMAAKKLKQLEVLRDRHDQYRARVAAVDEKSRELASLKKKKLRQTAGSCCPYCGGALGHQPHLDHIYPISFGGLSQEQNLVVICSSCNIKKGNLTLREFIEKFNLDRHRIESVLAGLGKKF